MAEIGMQYPVWAELTGDSNGTPVYGAGVVMGKAVSANLNWQREDNELYGDDVVAETDNSITGYTLDLTTTDLIETVENKVLGLALGVVCGALWVLLVACALQLLVRVGWIPALTEAVIAKTWIVSRVVALLPSIGFVSPIVITR